MADSSDAPNHSELLALTAKIVEAHATKNSVAVDALPGVIRSVFGALSRADAGELAGKPREPAVPVNRSIQRDYLVCLEDGAKVKTLKRYLMRFGLTPEAYRAKWGLSPGYPMVAPAYAERRSALAKQFGLGRVSPASKMAAASASAETVPAAAASAISGPKSPPRIFPQDINKLQRERVAVLGYETNKIERFQ